MRGNVEGGLLVSTEQYKIQVQGQRNVKRQLEEWEDLGPWRGSDMLTLLVPECVIDEDTEPFPWREEMLRRLQQGQPVINRKYIHAEQSEPAVPDWFEDHRITAENIERLTHPSLLPVREEDELLNSYEFWLDEQFCRVSVYGDEHTEGISAVCIFRMTTIVHCCLRWSHQIKVPTLLINISYSRVNLSG